MIWFRIGADFGDFGATRRTARTCNSLCDRATFWPPQTLMAATGGMFRLPAGASGLCRQCDETLEIDMLKKPLVIAAVAAALTTATLSGTGLGNGDPALGALLGAGIGAAIGNSVNHHNGALVGGAIGAVAGASIAANSGGYYGARATCRLLRRCTAGVLRRSPAYYPPAPAYYAPPAVVYRPRRSTCRRVPVIPYRYPSVSALRPLAGMDTGGGMAPRWAARDRGNGQRWSRRLTDSVATLSGHRAIAEATARWSRSWPGWIARFGPQ